MPEEAHVLETRPQLNKLLLTKVSFVYKAGKDEDAYWLAQNSRQSKKHQGLYMSFTCLQKVYSVLHHKARYEKAHGEIGSGQQYTTFNIWF